MGRNQCAAFGCTKSRETFPNLRFHRFPQKRWKEWLAALKNPHLQGLEYQQIQRLEVCGSHFQPTDYNSASRRSLLKDEASPSVNLHARCPLVEVVDCFEDMAVEAQVVIGSNEVVVDVQASDSAYSAISPPTTPPARVMPAGFMDHSYFATTGGGSAPDFASRAPDLDCFVANMQELCVLALKEIQSKLTVGDLARKCAAYANSIAVFMVQCDASRLVQFLAEELKKIYELHKVVFLSSLRDLFTKATNRLLNNSEFRTMLKDLLRDLRECPENELNFFTGNFILTLSSKILVFVSQRMQDRIGVSHSEPRKRGTDDFSSLRFKQIVHYIGGSVVAGIKRRHRNYPNAARIKSFYDVMASEFVENKEDEATWCSENVKKRTQTRSRGLALISLKAYDFFYELVCLTMNHEEDDGSVLIETVNVSVKNSFKLIELWDALVGDFVEEECSLEWLLSIVEIVCRCVSKGIVKRRVNKALQKSVSNVAHRPKLAR